MPELISLATPNREIDHSEFIRANAERVCASKSMMAIPPNDVML